MISYALASLQDLATMASIIGMYRFPPQIIHSLGVCAYVVIGGQGLNINPPGGAGGGGGNLLSMRIAVSKDPAATCSAASLHCCSHFWEAGTPRLGATKAASSAIALGAGRSAGSSRSWNQMRICGSYFSIECQRCCRDVDPQSRGSFQSYSGSL